MKYIVIILFFTALFGGCKDPGKEVFEMIDTTGKMTIKEGMFVNSVHQVSGTASILESDSGRILLLDNFKTENGPALKVYLAKSTNNTSIIDLGDLKGTSGKFSYPIDRNANINGYNYVLIWCEKFSVLFGYAQINTK
jgi:hypothetical protein